MANANTIGPATRINGSLETDEDLMVEGRIEGGPVRVRGRLSVAARGIVLAESTAPFSDPGVAFYRVRLRDLLKLLSYEEREVVLSSGRTSNFYIDCKQAVLTAEGHFLCGRLVAHVVERVAPEVRAVGGLTM